MLTPGPQRYRSHGRQLGIDESVLNNAVATIERIRATNPLVMPVLTLRHLGHLAEIPFSILRGLVARRILGAYKSFNLKKRVPGRRGMRKISVPNPILMKLQRWIVENILQHTQAHDSSYAFHPQCRPYDAAFVHCGCNWLLKIDLEDFFHTISEGRVAAVFVGLGFSRLLSFELARLVTIELERPGRELDVASRWPKIPYYHCRNEGVLPQGAPTSPMLANLVMSKTDETLTRLAQRHGMKYTRYADDLAFSCGIEKNLQHVRRLMRLVLYELNHAGFRHNHRKTVIRGPGTRRIVLGMLVDGDRPRLPREYKDMIRLHLHYLKSPSHGPSMHAIARRTSVSGIFHHVRGLISWAETVEPKFGELALEEFYSADWPPIRPKATVDKLNIDDSNPF